MRSNPPSVSLLLRSLLEVPSASLRRKAPASPVALLAASLTSKGPCFARKAPASQGSEPKGAASPRVANRRNPPGSERTEGGEEAVSVQVFLQIFKEGVLQIQSQFIIIDEKYQSYCNFEQNSNTIVYFTDLTEQDEIHTVKFTLYHLNKQFPELFCILPDNLFIDLLIYFSIKDLTYAFGYDNMFPYYTGQKKLLYQRRNIKGLIVFQYYYEGRRFKLSFRILDLFGISSAGLEQLARANGIEMTSKDILSKYEYNPALMLQKDPNGYMSYSMDDAKVLCEIYENSIKSFNQILQDIYNLPSQLHFTKTTFPTTIGSLVNSIWMKNYKYNILKDNKILYLATYVQGVLNRSHKNYIPTNQTYFQKLKSIKSLHELINFQNDYPEEFEKMYYHLSQSDVFIFHIYQYASPIYLISESADTTTRPILGVTSGGRTVNERPLEVTIEYGADPDISGAYAGALNKTIYPIGRPRILAYSSNQTQTMTLGDFMHNYVKDKITTGLFKVVVSGKLSFYQDLIISKIIPDDFSKKKLNLDKINPDDATINSQFVLLRKEIINGTITETIWDVLTKVATNQELNEIKNLKVECALYWLDNDMVGTIEELADEFLKDPGECIFNNELKALTETRTHKWFPYPISKFVDPLLKQRMQLKSQKDSFSQSLQQSLKLIINTTWGNITSPYFGIGNVVCSEIVTAKIRTSVWLMSKALNTHLSIQLLTEVHFL